MNSSDEDQIHALVEAWRLAAAAGDVDAMLELMTDDVVFLTPGRGPMRKEEFATLSRAAGAARGALESVAEIQEIKVCGDHAFMWTKLTVRMTPSAMGRPVERAGHTLTVLRRAGGKWRLARDANLLSPAADAAPSPA